jgi:hypothetical protein
MATLYGVNKTKIDAMKPSNILSAGEQGGKVRCLIDTYVGLGTESSADVIEMCQELPKGAKILFGLIQLKAVGGTPDLGDYEDTDRYVDEASDNAVTTFSDTITGCNYEVDMTTASTPDNQLIVTLDGAVTLAGVITVVVFYTVE